VLVNWLIYNAILCIMFISFIEIFLFNIGIKYPRNLKIMIMIFYFYYCRQNQRTYRRGRGDKLQKENG